MFAPPMGTTMYLAAVREVRYRSAGRVAGQLNLGHDRAGLLVEREQLRLAVLEVGLHPVAARGRPAALVETPRLLSDEQERLRDERDAARRPAEARQAERLEIGVIARPAPER